MDSNAYKVARYLYPEANLELGDVRTYKPGIRFDYVVGNPPFHLKWWTESGNEMSSQLYYCVKAAELLKPLGILALVVPRSFLAESFLDGGMIREMEKRFRFLGQVALPDNAFASKGVSGMPTKGMVPDNSTGIPRVPAYSGAVLSASQFRVRDSHPLRWGIPAPSAIAPLYLSTVL